MEIKTKFNIGDKVYGYKDNKIFSFKIEAVNTLMFKDTRLNIISYSYWAKLKADWVTFREENVASTEEELKDVLKGNSLSKIDSL